MRITIETTNQDELAQILKLLKALNLSPSSTVEVKSEAEREPSVRNNVIRGDKSIDPSELFGMWKAQSRTIEEIRAGGPGDIPDEKQQLKQERIRLLTELMETDEEYELYEND